MINALSPSGFFPPGSHFPDQILDGASLASIIDYTYITIKTEDQAVTWTITFSNGVKVEECNVVPVTLVSFNSQKVNNTAKLKWVTNSEYNMSKYVVERSSNGSQFQTIGAVLSVNDPNVHNYQYIDNTSAASIQYYRLRMVNIDGKISYSSITYVQGLTAVTQPGAITCNYSMNGTNSLCNKATEKYSLSTYPDFSNVTWSASAFYPLPAIDATTIDLCLSTFHWATFRTTKGGIKLHTQIDLKTAIPEFILFSNASLHDVNVLDVINFE